MSVASWQTRMKRVPAWPARPSASAVTMFPVVRKALSAVPRSACFLNPTSALLPQIVPSVKSARWLLIPTTEANHGLGRANQETTIGLPNSAIAPLRPRAHAATSQLVVALASSAYRPPPPRFTESGQKEHASSHYPRGCAGRTTIATRRADARGSRSVHVKGAPFAPPNQAPASKRAALPVLVAVLTEPAATV